MCQRSHIIQISEGNFDKDSFLLPRGYDEDIKSVLIPHGLIEDRVEKMAFEIAQFYENNPELHLVCILKGGRAFFSLLASFLIKMGTYRGIKFPTFYEHYCTISSYKGRESGDVLVTGMDLQVLANKHVLVCEDIIDTGRTLSKFSEKLKEAGVASQHCASLLEKSIPRPPGLNADFVGFSIPDTFIVGFCLDYEQKYRDLKHICELHEDAFS
jgi:hypoxanthine phosphoribosyltransferase